MAPVRHVYHVLVRVTTSAPLPDLEGDLGIGEAVSEAMSNVIGLDADGDEQVNEGELLEARSEGEWHLARD